MHKVRGSILAQCREMCYNAPMNYGYFRAAAASVELKVCDTAFNSEKIITAAHEAASRSADLLVLPELSITGYTCGDLFFQETLLQNALSALAFIAKETSSLQTIIAVGLPVKKSGSLYNAAAILHKGEILALVPKTYIPNHGEFYEARHFASSKNLRGASSGDAIFISQKFPEVPFGTDILICAENFPGAKIAFEICEDLWTATPPSTSHALAGATIIANLSASNETIGKAEYRRLLVKSTSARNFCAYIYANSGRDESTQDMVFAGHNLISENGKILAESAPFESRMIFADIDVSLLEAERIKTTTFLQCESDSNAHKEIFVNLKEKKSDGNANFFRAMEKHPFVPQEKNARDERCLEVITLQAQSLAKRFRHIGAKSAVLGLSGGLDSTLALLVTCRAFDLCSLDRRGIIAVTMPGFGTTGRTYENACSLAKETGATLREIPISDSVRQHFKDIGQDESVHDATYENAQARERTQILMDLANKEGAIVIGTGDLSELALGWCTYNGDHMSMYGVNSSIPKTLVRHIVEREAAAFAQEKNGQAQNKKLSEVLFDILNTPVSPELLPPEQGGISQKTEEIVGPYELHDFFLYNILRFGFSPSKIYFLAKKAFAENEYPPATIKHWMKVFYKRFFSQQFKRSCMPDGAKVGSVSLSPRGDWRMPSDASADAWLSEINSLE